MRPWPTPVLVICCLLGIPSSALAQSVSEHRVTVSADIGIQIPSTSRTDVAQFEINQEVGSVNGTQTLGSYTVFDGRGSVLVWKRLGVGLSLSRAQGEATASVEAEVPHPFFFDFDRAASASAENLKHRELVYHISAHFAMPLGSSTLLTVSGGPSFFDAFQDVVSGIDLSEQGFPFDTVDIATSHIERLSATSWGYHVGVDLAYYGLARGSLHNLLGVGILVRYSRSRPRVALGGVDQAVWQLGSVHAVGGLRIGF